MPRGRRYSPVQRCPICNARLTRPPRCKRCGYDERLGTATVIRPPAESAGDEIPSRATIIGQHDPDLWSELQDTCSECGHVHAGLPFGGICVGCPCPVRYAT